MKVIYIFFCISLSTPIFAGRVALTEQELIEVGITPQQEIAECLNKQFKSYLPSIPQQKTLRHIFRDKNFLNDLEKAESPITFLEQYGFKVLRVRFPWDTVVVEHQSLPGYVIKFLRIVAPKGWVRTINKGVFQAPKVSDRVINAQAIDTIVKQHNMHHVRVPKKFFYCVNNIAIVIAQKIIPSKRTFKDLHEKEIREILSLISLADGMLDIKTRNMILTKDKIYFIDTERNKLTNWWSFVEKYVDAFKAEINPKYYYIVDEWRQQETKKQRS